MEKVTIPAFATEAEEADWLYEHRDEITRGVVEAVRSGHNGIGSRGRYQQMLERKAQEQDQQPQNMPATAASTR